MPAYNAEKTLKRTVDEVNLSVVDAIVIVDDYSRDKTREEAEALKPWYPVHYLRHEANLGYGGNQKTCYAKALELGADIVVMLHPDYQYTPRLIPAMAEMLASGLYDVVLASRILGGGALRGGMPLYKYVSNRILTLLQNVGTGLKLSEYHTGYRAFTRQVLETLPLDRNDDDFIFDNEMLMQAAASGFRIAEITCPTKYFDEASSINFARSVKYGWGCLWNTVLYRLHKWGLYRARIFRFERRR